MECIHPAIVHPQQYPPHEQQNLPRSYDHPTNYEDHHDQQVDK